MTPTSPRHAVRDSVDAHVERWSKELPQLDPLTEGVVTRMQLLVKHLKARRSSGLVAHGLKPPEYDTMHALAIRGTPHQATPSELAADLKVSPAAMTGRLDNLERAGYVRRLAVPDDRRRVVAELTPDGYQAWLRGLSVQEPNENALVNVLSAAEQRQLNSLLKRMLAAVESGEVDRAAADLVELDHSED